MEINLNSRVPCKHWTSHSNAPWRSNTISMEFVFIFKSCNSLKFFWAASSESHSLSLRVTVSWGCAGRGCFLPLVSPGLWREALLSLLCRQSHSPCPRLLCAGLFSIQLGIFYFLLTSNVLERTLLKGNILILPFYEHNLKSFKNVYLRPER